MSPDLTLPVIPGLIRRTTPMIDSFGRRGVVSALTAHDWTITLDDIDEQPKHAIGPLPIVGWSVDLTDATGRAHAAWRLASLPQYARITGPYNDAPRWCRPFTSEQVWHLRSYGCAPFRARSDIPDPNIVVPSLADLDPNDDTRLPDGSRWVDAEALRRVVLHVAGVTNG